MSMEQCEPSGRSGGCGEQTEARYQYNGHRTPGRKAGGVLQRKTGEAGPAERVGMEIGNSRQITYTLDLTRQYYNLLERTEEKPRSRDTFGMGTWQRMGNGERNYYLQDELGSPLRIEDSAGTIKEGYEYGALWGRPVSESGKMQPFGYTGYKRQCVRNLLCPGREYLAENGRFRQDLIVGFVEYPETLNRYSYC